MCLSKLSKCDITVPPGGTVAGCVFFSFMSSRSATAATPGATAGATAAPTSAPPPPGRGGVPRGSWRGWDASGEARAAGEGAGGGGPAQTKTRTDT